MTEQRIKAAYNTFRGGVRHADIPQWDDAPSWVRDAMRVAYLQGKLDGRSAPRDEPMTVEPSRPQRTGGSTHNYRHCEFCHVPMAATDCCDSECESKVCHHMAPVPRPNSTGDGS
jgi:hypothetical protein